MSAVVAAYQDATEALAADTERRVLALYAAATEGTHSGQVVALIAAIIGRANAAAGVLADIGLAVQIEQSARAATPTLGIVTGDDTGRLSVAVGTILDSDADTAMQLSRLARAEPLDAGQRAMSAAMLNQPRVRGWVRECNPGACELCEWWARGGRTYPVDYPFRRHPGCNCAARIVLN